MKDFENHSGDAFLRRDRKSTRLNSSHTVISYAVFCLIFKIHSYQHEAHIPLVRLVFGVRDPMELEKVGLGDRLRDRQGDEGRSAEKERRTNEPFLIES